MVHGLRMNWKIAILSFGLVFFALSIGGTILVGRLIQVREDEISKRLGTIARTVAQMPVVLEELRVAGPEGKEKIESAVDKLRIINNVDYIVVMDMQGRRWSHPVSSLIGKVSEGEDQHPAFAEHTYISKAKGELGTSLRAFVPIMNDQQVQVGVALVGQILPSLWKHVTEMGGPIYITLILSLLFGIWGSWLLAIHIKKQMFELEPQEIARLLTERTAAFQALHEGVIVIDNKERITIFNDKAMIMLDVKNEVVGRSIRDVVPDSRLPEILDKGEPDINQETQIGSVFIMMNRIPIKVGAEIVGAIAIFQDQTEVKQMAEELTGVKEFVDALRVQNHEYMNKLHTIGGLIQLSLYDRALEYVFKVKEQREELTDWISDRIQDGNLAGLLLGKISRGTELGIDVVIDPQSRLHRFPNYLDHHDFVVLIGNLIENAFEAMRHQEGDKLLYVSLEQDDNICSIMVEDNGIGMTSEVREHIFERGFSTKKGAGSGIGLFLIKSIVDKGNGQIQINTAPGRGTDFLITLPMHIRGTE